MSFKKWGAVILAAGMLGCAKQRVSDSQPIVVNLNNGAGGCVSDMSQNLTTFFDGKMSQPQISAFWDCLAQAVNDYQTVTEGDLGPGRYSDQALRAFVEKYFVSNRKVTDQFLASLMQLKQVLLSGSATEVTDAELDRLRTLLGVMKGASLQVQPFATVLFQVQPSATDAELDGAGKAAQGAIGQLAGWLSAQGQDYTADQMNQLLQQTSAWMKAGGNSSTTIDKLIQAITVFPSAKSAFLGGDKTKVAGSEWMGFGAGCGKLLYVYTSLNYGFKDNIDAAMIRNVLPNSLAQIADLLTMGVNGHPTGVVGMEEWSNLFAALVQVQWLPSALNAPGLNAMWNWLLIRPLGDGVTKPTGLTAANIAVLRQFAGDWTTLLNSPSTSTAPLVTQFNSMLAESKPMTWDSLGRQVYPLQVPAAWGDNSRLHMVWQFALLRFLKTAYVGPDRGYLVQTEFDTAVAEVLPLLQNFGWLTTAGVADVSSHRFREADLFMTSSNGNNQLELGEAVRYLSYMVTGYRSAQIWLDLAQTACGGPDAACMRNLALDPSTNILGAMPRLQAQIAKWPQGEFITYMNHAESTILGGVRSGTFSTGDLVEVWQLFQYAETFIQLYDADFSETINLNESLAAYPLYSPTLSRLLPLPADQEQGFYTFMFKYGDTPLTMFGGLVVYDWWLWHPANWSYEADRNILMSILNQLTKL